MWKWRVRQHQINGEISALQITETFARHRMEGAGWERNKNCSVFNSRNSGFPEKILSKMGHQCRVKFGLKLDILYIMHNAIKYLDGELKLANLNMS